MQKDKKLNVRVFLEDIKKAIILDKIYNYSTSPPKTLVTNCYMVPPFFP